MDEQLSYDTGTTGLVLIDLLNEFMADDGKLNSRIAGMIESQDLISQLSRLIAGAREAGLPIFYAPHGLDEHSYDDIVHLHPIFRGAVENKTFWKGSNGADFYPPLRPRDGETVLTQHRMYDSFIGTDLQVQLRARGIQKIVFAGLTSSGCIEGTGRHALEAGYHVTFIADAVADFSVEEHRAAVDLAYPVYGHQTVTVGQFLGAVVPA